MTKGNSANLIRGRKKAGVLGERVFSRRELDEAREQALEQMADEASRVLGATGAGMNHIERMMGRRTASGKVRRILAGDDVKVGSLAELATVAGLRLVIRFE